ncbi:hypothetical protein MP638_003451 [Amoeboaphelidium occidentale]|nr:hypothetical protein MP638_003451 [Amoeboaphelidium occidentale]
MTIEAFDIVIVGAGPVGLFAAYLACRLGLSVKICDVKQECNQVGRADALNARTLSILEHLGLADELLAIGKKCNTSSIFQDGEFVKSQSEWWQRLVGCRYKHFLMIGQPYLERMLVRKLEEDYGVKVTWNTSVDQVEVDDADAEYACIASTSCGKLSRSKFIIAADGPKSTARKCLGIKFEVTLPQIRWAVIDAKFDTDFPKVPHIIVFQGDTADVAWIPREDPIDRFYIRLDGDQEGTVDYVMERIKAAVKPYKIEIANLVWFSEFCVKEAVSEKYYHNDRIFLVGDACHCHPMNGGLGLNTGLSDSFNLVWKFFDYSKRCDNDLNLLQSYQEERKQVAMNVISISGALTRKTKLVDNENEKSHAVEYMQLVEKYSGMITGMGVEYKNGLWKPALNFELYFVSEGNRKVWLFDILKYNGKPHIIQFHNIAGQEKDGDRATEEKSRELFNLYRISCSEEAKGFEFLDHEGNGHKLYGQAEVFIRPDLYYKHGNE